MKWADDSINRGATVDFLVVSIHGKDKFYYPCTIPDSVVLTSNEWGRAVDALRMNGIGLDWIRDTRSSEEYLHRHGYKRV